ncbi:MAG: hypothetical protein QM497_08135 [Sulfurimonas sp.]
MKNSIKKIISTILLASVFSGCSNLDVGFEESSVFHSDVKKENFKNAIVNIYLDKNTDNKDKFRLVINGEDTEMNLYHNVITRFGIDKKDTTIALLKNDVRISSIDLILENKKNYYLSITQNKDTKLATMQKIDKSKIDPKTKATALFTSEKIGKEEEIKVVKVNKEIKKQEKIDYAQKQKVGIETQSEYTHTQDTSKHEIKPSDTKKEISKHTPKQSDKEAASNKTIKQSYEEGEAVFYYDPNDGE